MSKKVEVLLDETYGLDNECKFYTYIYLDPRVSGVFNYQQCCFAYKPFYVGKGSGNRYLFHTKNVKRKDRKINSVKAILNQGLKPIVLKIPVSDEKKAFLLEKILIEDIGRLDINKGPLLNNTDGGEGNSGNLTSEKLVASKKHNFITNHPMLNESIKKVISFKNSELWKSGEHPSLVFLKSDQNRIFHSNKMKANNPMKNPESVRKMLETKKKNRELKNGLE